MGAGELTLSVEDAAKLLGISRGLAYDAARRGELPTIRLGRRLLVPTAHLLELVGAARAGMKKSDSPAFLRRAVADSPRVACLRKPALLARIPPR